MIPSCTESLRKALAAYPGQKPAAALLFSCAGRKMIMGTKVPQETETVRRYLGDIPFCGFYSYGEFGPLERGGRSLFHGTTFVTLLFGPAAEE
jgi:small ligand-binding sensory domain FIST